MNCISCNDVLNNSSDVNRDTRRYPVKLEDGNIYCQGCADAYYVFNTPSKKTNNKENIAPLDSIKNKSMKQSTCISTYTCFNSKCRKQASGPKCESCGHPSPLCRKR